MYVISHIRHILIPVAFIDVIFSFFIVNDNGNRSVMMTNDSSYTSIYDYSPSLCVTAD